MNNWEKFRKYAFALCAWSTSKKSILSTRNKTYETIYLWICY